MINSSKDNDGSRVELLDRAWPDELNVRVWRGRDRVPLSDEKIDSIIQEDAERDARRIQRQRDSERRDREFREEVERRVQEDMIRAEVISRLPEDVRALLYPRQPARVVVNNSGSSSGSVDGLLPFLAGAAVADLCRALT